MIWPGARLSKTSETTADFLLSQNIQDREKETAFAPSLILAIDPRLRPFRVATAGKPAPEVSYMHETGQRLHCRLHFEDHRFLGNLHGIILAGGGKGVVGVVCGPGRGNSLRVLTASSGGVLCSLYVFKFSAGPTIKPVVFWSWRMRRVSQAGGHGCPRTASRQCF